MIFYEYCQPKINGENKPDTHKPTCRVLPVVLITAAARPLNGQCAYCNLQSEAVNYL